MKQLACASYDYMKLMVVELKQQINEIETRERLAAERDGGGDNVGGEPKAPPRTRHNPFNGGGGGVKEKSRCSWSELHEAYGERVVRNRTAWLRSKQAAEPPATLHHQHATIAMRDDNLLVVL